MWLWYSSFGLRATKLAHCSASCVLCDVPCSSAGVDLVLRLSSSELRALVSHAEADEDKPERLLLTLHRLFHLTDFRRCSGFSFCLGLPCCAGTDDVAMPIFQYLLSATFKGMLARPILILKVEGLGFQSFKAPSGDIVGHRRKCSVV